MAQKIVRRKSTTKSKYASQKGLRARVKLVEDSVAKAEYPQFKAGDNVRVHVRIKEGDKERIQAFDGLVIARGNHAGGKSFTVRKISHGVGVERTFLENSPKVAKLEVVQSGSVRRAKLYYIRELQGRAAKIEQEREAQAEKPAKA